MCIEAYLFAILRALMLYKAAPFSLLDDKRHVAWSPLLLSMIIRYMNETIQNRSSPAGLSADHRPKSKISQDQPSLT